MKNLLLLIAFLFASVSQADFIPGGDGSPASFPNGATITGGTFSGANDFASGLSINSGTVISAYEEGTYTPTFSDFSSNITDINTPTNFRYQRIGPWVYVSGQALVNQSGAGEGFAQLTLPIASDLVQVSDLVGTCAIEDAGFKPIGNLRAQTTNDRAQVQIETSTANNSRTMSFNFRYLVQ